MYGARYGFRVFMRFASLSFVKFSLSGSNFRLAAQAIADIRHVHEAC